MITTYVTYAGQTDTPFDRDHWINAHLPLVRECWGPYGLLSVSGRFPAGDGGGLVAIAPCVFRDEAAMEAALASPETARVVADVDSRAKGVPAGTAAKTIRGESALYIAHEVNQPLAAIRTNAEGALRWLTRNPPDLKGATEALERIIGNVCRAANVVRSLGETTREATTTTASVNLTDVIDKLLHLLSLDLRHHRIAVETEFTDDLKAIKGDGDQIERVIANLVANAIEAMRTVHDRPRRLRIKTEPDKSGGTLISVEDSGEGVDPAHIDRIFDPLFTTKRDGMGIGLPICRSIIETYKGRLWVTPNVPYGSVFRFVIPRFFQQDTANE